MEKRQQQQHWQQQSEHSLTAASPASPSPHPPIHLVDVIVTLISSLCSFITSALRSLFQYVWHDASLPARVLCAAYLAVNLLLPLLFVQTAVARVVLLHCLLCVTASGCVLRLLGRSLLLLLLLLCPCALSLLLLLLQLPSAFASCCALLVVERRPVLLLPPHLLSPALFLLWLYSLCLTNTVCLVLLLAEVSRAVKLERTGEQQGEGGGRLAVRLPPGQWAEEGELAGQWQLELMVELKARRRKTSQSSSRAAEDESRMEEGEPQSLQQRQESDSSGSGSSSSDSEQGWSGSAIKREAAEAAAAAMMVSDEELPHAPPSSPASPQPPSRPPPLEPCSSASQQLQQRQQQQQQQAEQRGPFQSPRAAHDSPADLRETLRRGVASHQHMMPSSASVSAPHGDPVLQAASMSVKNEQDK